MHQVPAGIGAVPLDQGQAAPAGGPERRPRVAAAAKANVMTMMAGTAMGVSQAFNAGFKRPFPGWTAELAEPVGPSTGGGKQALQPITITSGAGEKLSIGRVDPVRSSVSLRNFQAVSGMHGDRYGRPLPVSPEDYGKFISTVQVFFKAMQFNVTDELYVRPSKAKAIVSGENRTTWILVGSLVVMIVGLLAYIALTR